MPHPKSTLTFAYASLKYEMLDKSLRGKDDVLRTKILTEIIEDFHQADKVNIALESEILVQLVKAF